MVKEIHIILDNKEYKELLKFKEKAKLTWKELLKWGSYS